MTDMHGKKSTLVKGENDGIIQQVAQRTVAHPSKAWTAMVGMC
jgi:hypothetical protein